MDASAKPVSTKRIWLLVGIIVLVVGLGLLLYFLLRKKSTSLSLNTTVNVVLSDPYRAINSSVVMSKSSLQTLTINDFLEDVFDNIDMPIILSNIYWTQLSINSITLTISQGQIQNTSTPLLQFINETTIPGAITISGGFQSTCILPATGSCNICLGQTLVCSATGWACSSDYAVCGTGPEIYTCCDETDPFVTCNNGTATCGQCPGSIDCSGGTTEQLCQGWGPLCTATGWICALNQTCPSDLSQCCTDVANPYAQCINNNVQCFPCPGTGPPCPANCSMDGLVCVGTGVNMSRQCLPNTTCPPQSVLFTCCTDPRFPVPFCASTGISCINCDNMPKIVCEESCNGNGLVCTATGWVCLPNQQCPTSASVISTCCSNDMIPYCDSSNCIKCACPQGYTGCASYSQQCSGTNAPSDGCSICCPEDTPCTVDPITNKCLCCEASQVCSSGGNPICCPPGTMCNSGQCDAICGISDTGSPIFCPNGQECAVIENITPAMEARMKSSYPNAVFNVATNGNTNAYICMPTSTCSFSNEYSTPASINNFYPCYSFPMNGISVPDPTQPGIGYCIETSVSVDPSGFCIGPSVGSTGSICFANATSTDCIANENCVWRNVLEYVTNTSDPQTAARQLQCDIAFLQNNKNGNYCDPTNNEAAYSRVISYQGISCDWTDCYTKLSQPNVIDVYYNTDTGVCAGIQACNAAAGSGMSSYTINNSGVQTPIDGVSLPDSIPSCTNATVCPIGIFASTGIGGLVCEQDGVIGNYGWIEQGGSTPSTFYCTFTDVSNYPNAVYTTEQNCLQQNCGSCFDENGTRTGTCDPQNLCCANGFLYDLYTDQCYQDVQAAQKAIEYSVCKNDGCSGQPGACSPSWFAHCHGTTRCNDNCCSNRVPDGGGNPYNAARPYCVVDQNNTWQDYNQVNGYCFNEDELAAISPNIGRSSTLNNCT